MTRPSSKSSVAAVVIGRNEGQRLLRCLESVKGQFQRLVYVDSGSTDGSVAAAIAAGAETVVLDRSQPYTAARARNEGIATLRAGTAPDFVQFIDGDCELQAAWVASSCAFLDSHANAAVAAGRLRERFPEMSIYNRLCDREWNTPTGRSLSCGGVALMRFSAVVEVEGFNAALLAGEEPELCLRLRAAGWEIWRLDVEMALHDAAMVRFGQWWKRSERSGHAAAEGVALHGFAEHHGLRTVMRALGWGFLLPTAAVLLSALFTPWWLALAAAYLIQIIRVALRSGGTRGEWEAAVFLAIGKFPEMLGVFKYALSRLTRRPRTLIEYD